MRSKDSTIKDQRFIEPSPLFGSKSGIMIGDDVWIGANSVILEGARVGNGVVITAGSVIKGDLKEYGIYAGNPLKCIGYRR